MRWLLDTQCWLWMTSAPERFDVEVRRHLEDSHVTLFFSAACAWEIAIKYQLGKLELPEPPALYVPGRLRQTRVTPLAVTHEHALRAGELPAHHRDPFDRLLLAQAQLEQLPLLTADETLAKYDVEIVRA